MGHGSTGEKERSGRFEDKRAILAVERNRWILAYLRHAPVSLCIRELNRLIAAEMLDRELLPRSPVLDVGCGDAFWWTQRDARGRQVYGIDISASEIAQAAERIEAKVADISAVRPFAPTRFRDIVGNCSLEHVRDIDSALRNLREVAASDARFVLFVPTPQWAYQGNIQRWLLSRAPRLAMTLAGAMNGFFQHWHLYDLRVWQRLLERNGWRVVRAHGLGSPRSEFLFRLFLPLSFPEFLAKTLIGVYPSRLLRFIPDVVLSPLRRLVSWALSDPIVSPDAPNAYEYVIVAECASDAD